MKHSKRNVVVLTSLIALLSFTSALLLALAPPPLAAEGYGALAAGGQGQYLDQVFHTAVAAKPEQWKYIYIHHSGTASGSAQTLAVAGMGLCDHFLVGNGEGCQDGEIQIGQRWNQQQPAAAPPGVDHIEPNCLSICLVGDFDKTMPTPMQLRRLTQLVSTLQAQLRIPAERVILLNQPGTPSSVGRYFPVTAFRDQILP
ncbi:MAG: peptidoglycan recognition family protein [Tepidisphaeraceae bacterium]